MSVILTKLIDPAQGIDRVASLFEQYITYRDDWLDAWAARRA